MDRRGGWVTRHAAGLLFSFAVHGALAGTLLNLTADRAAPPPEQVYRVSLAELAPPEPPVTVPEPPPPEPPPAEPPPPPPPEPVVEPPKPAPPPVRKKEPQIKKISPKKQPDKPPERPKKVEEAPPAPPPPVTTGTPRETAAPARPAGPPANPNAVYQQDRVDQRPAIARQVAPKYPQRARRMNVEGQVMVRLVVDKSGQARDCAVVSADPPGWFEEAALEAAARTRFVPGKIRGQAVNTLVVIPFAFRLR